jgi:ABC-2 type transport system ATP-binding protein
MSEAIIRTTNLKKSYKKGIFAVAGLNLEIESGKITGFLGPNGAGKSTTIKMMLGLLEPTDGAIEIFGKKMTTDSPRIRKDIGFMPELPKFPKYLTGLELLKIYGEMAEIPKDILIKQAKELLEEVGLKNDMDKKIGKYSKGMQQRLGVAVAFLGTPKLVIMDEPTVGLDPVGMVDIKQLLKQKVKNGITIFLSSHLLNETEEVCDEVIVINHGKMVISGSVSKVISEAYKKNILEIEVDKIDNIPEALKQYSFLSNIKVTGNKITLELNTTEDLRAQISKAIVEKGAVILRMGYVTETLENAFIELLKNGGNN